MRSSNQVMKAAYKMIKDGVVYGYGYKYETVTASNIRVKARAFAYSAENIRLMKKKIGKKAIDCSGFVNRAAGTNLGGSGEIKNKSPRTWKVSDSKHAKKGMFLWHDGHIALIDVKNGKKYVVEAASTASDLKVTPWEKRAKDFVEYGEIKGVNYGKTPLGNRYTQDKFLYEVKKCLGISQSSSRAKVLAHTFTISQSTHKYSSLVTPLQRKLKSLGLYKGEIEADHGKSPIFGPQMATAVKAYEKKYVKKKKQNIHPDGVLEGKGSSWAVLLGIIK